MVSRIVANHQVTFLDNKINDYIHRPKELEDTNLYDFIEQYDVTYASKKNEADIMSFLDTHPQSDFRGVVNRLRDVTPLVSYLDFPDVADFEGNILDPALTPTGHTDRYAKCALCLFVPFRDINLFTAEASAVGYTQQLRTAMTEGKITETTQVQLQNIQDCRNMMKAGRQKDMLERTTEALPDPIKGKKMTDEQTETKLARHIDDCLTELVSQLDEDNQLGLDPVDSVDPLQFMSMTDLRGNDKQKCGYTCLSTPIVDGNVSVYVIDSNVNVENPNDATQNDAVTWAPRVVSKSRLT